MDNEFKFLIDAGLDDNAKQHVQNDIDSKLKGLKATIEQLNLDPKAAQALQNALLQNGINLNITVGQQQIQQAQRTGQHAGELVGKAFQKGLESVSSKGTGKRNFYTINQQDAKNFETAMKKQVNKWTNGKGELVDVKISTRSYFDEDIGKNLERLHQAAVVYKNDQDEIIKKTIAWRKIDTDPIDGSAIMGFAEVQSQYSKSLDNSSKATEKFVDKQKRAASKLDNTLAKIKADYENKNKAKPITNEVNIQELNDAYSKAEQAIKDVKTASVSGFTDAEIKAEQMINDLQIMVTKFRDVENASNKMKGINVDAGIDVAIANFDKLSTKAKEVGLDLSKLETAYTDMFNAKGSDLAKPKLDSFNDQLRVSQAELDAHITKINAKNDGRNQVNKAFEQRMDAYKEILTITEKINRLNPETDSAQIKELEQQRAEWQKINQSAAETMEYYAKQVLSEEELTQLAKNRAVAIRNVQNEVAQFFAVADEKARNKQDSSVTSKLASLDNKLDTEQYKYTQKYIDDQIEALQKYGIAADDAEKQVKELQNAFNQMSDKSLSGEQRLEAEKTYQTELNRTSIAVKEAKTKWQGLVTVQQRLSKANAIEAFLQKNTKITKEAKAELERYVVSLRDVDTAMSKVAKSNIDIRFKEIENSMRGLNKLGYALSDQMKQAASSFAQWISVSNMIMTGIYRTREAVNELINVDNILTEISKTSDMTKSELIELGNASFESASKLGRTAHDYLNTVMDMSRSGFYGDQAEAMAEQVLLAQTAGDLTQELASNYIISTNAAYKFAGDVKKINEVLGGMNIITNRNSVAMKDMAEAMSVAGTVASSYRVNPDEFAAIVGTIESVTKLGGNEVGNAAKALFINLQNITSSKIVGTLERAGASMTEMVDGVEKLRTPVEILRDLSETFNTLDEDDPLRAEILTNVGQKYHAAKLAALLENFDMYDKMLQDYSEGFGSAEKEAEKSANNVQGSLNKLSNNWIDIINNMLSSDTMLFGINTLNELLTLINGTTDALGEFGSIGMIGTAIASAKGYGLNHSLQPLFIRSYNNAI